MELSVIIVNYNVKYFLEQCLESLFRALDSYEEWEVFVVDNTSTDDSETYIRSRIHNPRLKWIANTENVGFGRANNQAVQLAAGRHILYLNPDTIVTPEALLWCKLLMQRNEETAVIGMRLVTATGAFLPESMRGFPDPFTSFYKISGLYRLFPRVKRFNRYYLSWLDSRKEYLCSEVKVLPGAYMYVQRRRLEELEEKGFDERFFMYGEDIDLSVRLSHTGNVAYLPEPIIHYKGESTNHNSQHYVKVFYEAMDLFQQKYYPRYRLLNSCLRTGISVVAFLSSLRRKMPLAPPSVESGAGFVIFGGKNAVCRIQDILHCNGIHEENYLCLGNVPSGDLQKQIIPANCKWKRVYHVFDVELYGYTVPIRLLSDYPYGPDAEIVFYSPERDVLLLADGTCYRSS